MLAIVFLDLLALLTLLGIGCVIDDLRRPVDPQGAVAWFFVEATTCLFFTALVITLAATGRMTFFPGGSLVRLVVGVGLVAGFGMSLVMDPGHDGGAIRRVWIAIHTLLLAACIVIVHQAHVPYWEQVRWGVGLTVGAGALLGWSAGIAVPIHLLWQSATRSQRQAQKQQEAEAECRRQQESYDQLAEDAPLSDVLPFTRARDEQLRQAAHERVAGFPDLNEHLSALLDQDSQDAIDYIASMYSSPSADLGSAYAGMLERQLEKWSWLQHKEYAGSWETNLRGFFRGAEKLQQAGADLRPQLRSWHEFLLKCKGLEMQAATIRALL